MDYTKKRKRTFVRLQNEKGEKRSLTKNLENLTHFSCDEVLSSQVVFDDWQEEDIEEEGEYLKRKRERAMRKTVEEIMKNELDELRREVFKSVFLYGEKMCDVAKRLGLSKAMAYRYYNQAVKTIGDNLKYVLLYRDGCIDTVTPLKRMQERVTASLKNAYIKACPLRLLRLMEKENISPEKMCVSLGIEKKRLISILKGSVKPDADEVVLFSDFFGVSADYILKGDLT